MKKKLLSVLCFVTVFVILVSMFGFSAAALTVADFPNGLCDAPKPPNSEGNYSSFVWVHLKVGDYEEKRFFSVPIGISFQLHLYTTVQYGGKFGFRFYSPSGTFSSLKTFNNSWTAETKSLLSGAAKWSESFNNNNWQILGLMYSGPDVMVYVNDVSVDENPDEQVIPPGMTLDKFTYYIDGYRQHDVTGTRKIAVPANPKDIESYTGGKLQVTQSSAVPNPTTGNWPNYMNRLRMPIYFKEETGVLPGDFKNVSDNAVPWVRVNFNEDGWYDAIEGKPLETGIKGWLTNGNRLVTYERFDGGMYLTIPFSLNPKYGEFEIIWKVDGKDVRKDIWKFEVLQGFVDTNNDGIDDRSQETDADGNIISDGSGVPVGSVGSGGVTNTFEDFKGIINGVKTFFTSAWGILPTEINVLIITAITVMIAIAVLKIVF